VLKVMMLSSLSLTVNRLVKEREAPFPFLSLSLRQELALAPERGEGKEEGGLFSPKRHATTREKPVKNVITHSTPRDLYVSSTSQGYGSNNKSASKAALPFAAWFHPSEKQGREFAS
jgi:hypothetical protein